MAPHLEKIKVSYTAQDKTLLP